jgi:hypothetical protein
MRKALLLMLLGLAVAVPATAQTGNGAPSGAHYSLNIIGVENPKTATLTGSDRHTIFVALGKPDDGVTSRIYLTPGEDFQVCDGNAFDTAYDCNGLPIGRTDGAVFQLPCNTNLTADPGQTLFPCEAEDPQLAYEVWIRALGAPGGSAVITTCAFDAETDEKICSSENVVLVRHRGQSKFTNVTQQLTSLVGSVSDPNSDGVICGRFALFRDEFVDWFWQYANKGLRLAQIRFYPL